MPQGHLHRHLKVLALAAAAVHLLQVAEVVAAEAHSAHCYQAWEVVEVVRVVVRNSSLAYAAVVVHRRTLALLVEEELLVELASKVSSPFCP